MSFSFILLFSFTVFMASIIPGPSMILALAHGMQYGAKRTIASAMGNVTVTLMQASISIAGLGTILIASKTVFLVIKWAGAIYLVYIGIMLIRSSGKSLVPGNSIDSTKIYSLRKMYLQAAYVTAGNPKAIVFFTAIFPQFIDVNAPYLYQSFVLMSIGSVIAFACFMIYAIGGEKLISLNSKGDKSIHFKRLLGGTFIGTGIGIATIN